MTRNELLKGSFTYSNWFGNDIYISPNNNVYCMYHFDDVKYLIMDMDMTIEELNNVDDFDRVTSEVLVYWMYVEDYMELNFMKYVEDIVSEYEENPKTFFEKYNTKNRQ